MAGADIVTGIIIGKDPAYLIKTERTILRCWQPGDAPLLKEAIDSSLDHLRLWLPWAEKEPEDVSAKVELLRTFRGKFDLGQDFNYGIFNHNESLVLGGCGLMCRIGKDAYEIGYWIRANHINQGLATEVAATLTKVAFVVEKVNRVEIHCDPDNVRSAAVPRKLEFMHEATLRQRKQRSDGTWHDVMIWTLLSSDFSESKAAGLPIEAYDAVGNRIL